jgi:hypothetical protein
MMRKALVRSELAEYLVHDHLCTNACLPDRDLQLKERVDASNQDRKLQWHQDLHLELMSLRQELNECHQVHLEQLLLAEYLQEGCGLCIQSIREPEVNLDQEEQQHHKRLVALMHLPLQQ